MQRHNSILWRQLQRRSQRQKNPVGGDEEETGKRRNRPSDQKRKNHKKRANSSNFDGGLLKHGKITSTSYRLSPPVNSLCVSDNNYVTVNVCENKNSKLTVTSPCPSALSLNSSSVYLSCNSPTSTISENNSVHSQKLPRHTRKLVNIMTANVDVITNKMPELATVLKLSQIDFATLTEISPKKFQISTDRRLHLPHWIQHLQQSVQSKLQKRSCCSGFQGIPGKRNFCPEFLLTLG